MTNAGTVELELLEDALDLARTMLTELDTIADAGAPLPGGLEDAELERDALALTLKRAVAEGLVDRGRLAAIYRLAKSASDAPTRDTLPVPTAAAEHRRALADLLERHRRANVLAGRANDGFDEARGTLVRR